MAGVYEYRYRSCPYQSILGKDLIESDLNGGSEKPEYISNENNIFVIVS
jgi:hypothetical protein